MSEIQETLLAILANYPKGATAKDISGQLSPEPNKRTLQYHLAQLTQKGILIAQGKTRNRRYQLKQPAQKQGSIALSTEGRAIQFQVSQPTASRVPVGYQPEFLNSYRPNVSQYLSNSLQEKLLLMGESPVKDYPAGTYAKQIFERLLIDLSWNSSRLEGNTYSLLETERLIELGEITEGKEIKEAQMILNHKAAIEFIVQSAESIGINRFTLLNLHAMLSNNLLRDPKACGRLRLIPVSIGQSVYQPLAIPQLIESYFKQVLDTANAIKNPFEQAFFLLVQLPYLQPFEDVNKRVSRLASNISLVQANLCPLSFVDVSQELYVSGLLGIYEQNRIELLRDVFLWAYERSCQLYLATRATLGDPDPFRLRYRKIIAETIFEIVHNCLDKKTAVSTIQKIALEKIVAEDRMRFIETVESEMIGLHEGNIARFGIQLHGYEAWQKTWF